MPISVLEQNDVGTLGWKIRRGHRHNTPTSLEQLKMMLFRIAAHSRQV
jgi:hypothetical protein